MNFYKVDYTGLWLGGKAIVAADSEEEAIALVRVHPGTSWFEGKDRKGVALQNPTAELIPVPGPCVLYNDNGDY